jgi:hypothetical protein
MLAGGACPGPRGEGGPVTTAAQAALLQRRAALLARSESLRSQFLLAAAALERPAAIADQLRGWAWRIRMRPQWLLAPVLAVAVLRPRRALAWSLKLWGAWRVWRQVLTALQR